MQRIPRHRLLAALLTFLSLIVVAMLPIGVASAASTSTTCPSDPFCILVISAPESVPAGQVFTVQVAVTTDGFTVAKSDPCASKVLVTLEVDGPSFVPEEEGSPVFPFLSTQSVNAKAGIATFSVSVQTPGSYRLVASAGVVGDAAPTTSNCSNYFYQSDTADFMAVLVVPTGQPIAPCPDNVSCTQVTSGSGSAATLFADSDVSFTASFIPFVAAEGCSNLSPADPGNSVLTFFLDDPTASKTVIFALSSDLITNGIGRYNICWRSPNEFTQLGGTQAPAVGPSICGPNGTSACFTGLLPNCKNSDDVGPCVLFRTSGQHNVGFFGIRAPAGDPQAYPGV
jgi:hypothetical protein